ncbi:50S ribosomal protein 5, chloroplastic [Carica papaya]|uniref:50S ribosomal protein 5, chloroplastic n=1 Tax=Carica papaya TaxID=3649 RepID=UPI000B8D1AEA|nr:50S ribosomal protein 5, chloroplastic [Carica papaya]
MSLLLLFTPLPSLFSSSFSSSSNFPVIASPISRLRIKPNEEQSKSRNGVCSLGVPFLADKRGALTVKASSDVDGAAPTDGSQSPEVEAVPVENLPLESKMQQRMEQKMKMKLAKKVRLRRKRLLRKRKMRKKGRWPPSKMKKLKNV